MPGDCGMLVNRPCGLPVFDFVESLVWSIGFLLAVHLLRQVCKIFGHEIYYSDLILPFSAGLTALCCLLVGDWNRAGTALLILVVLFAIKNRTYVVNAAACFSRFLAPLLKLSDK